MKKFTKTYKAIAKVASFGVSRIIKLQVSGLENLPSKGGFVIAANHYSEFDAMVSMKSLVDAGVPVRVLVKSELFKVPVLRWLMKKTGQVPVYRKTKRAADALRAAQTALESGEAVMIYPEGTLTREPNYWPMKPKKGVGYLALSGYPVIPMAQWGGLEVMGRYEGRIHLGRRKQTYATFGKAIDFSDLLEYEDKHLAASLAAERIMQEITRMLAEIRQEEPPVELYDSSSAEALTRNDLKELERQRRGKKK
ncbi:1-acyl-sn-glycerol-3-phosphate acyltransferase [Actinomycetaceae bacterium TAE3-ERU4]|nr:1-acyl-sn-glycerol-3-phosphate acyltransferase [Actinomycetaceae bacterium TAE3-ERU4]